MGRGPGIPGHVVIRIGFRIYSAWQERDGVSLLLGVVGAFGRVPAWTFQNKGIFISPILPLIVLCVTSPSLRFSDSGTRSKRVKERNSRACDGSRGND